MLVHTVFFYLKPEVTEVQRADFFIGVQILAQIPGVQAAYFGRPAGVPDRPVIEKGYAVALTALFVDVAAHNAYQVHPTHLAFIERYRDLWAKVQVFDSE